MLNTCYLSLKQSIMKEITPNHLTVFSSCIEKTKMAKSDMILQLLLKDIPSTVFNLNHFYEIYVNFYYNKSYELCNRIR